MSQFLAGVVVLLSISALLLFLYGRRESKKCPSNTSYNYLKMRCNCSAGLGGTYCDLKEGDKVAFTVNSPGGLPAICSPDTVSVLVFTGVIREARDDGAVIDFDSVNVINPSSADPSSSCNNEVIASFYKQSDPSLNATYLGSSDNPGSYYRGIIPSPTVPYKMLISLDQRCSSNGYLVNNQCVCEQGHSGESCA